MKRIDYLFEGIAGIGVILQPDYTLQILSLVLTCISVCISIIFTVYKFIKDVKSGKISNDDFETLKNLVDEQIEKLEKGQDKKDGKS